MTDIAVVVAGNRHILDHALQALEIRGVNTESALVIVTSMNKFRRDAVCDELKNHKWLEIVVGYDLAQKRFKSFFPVRLRSFLERSFLYELTLICKTLCRSREILRNLSCNIMISGFYGHAIDMTIANNIAPDDFILVDDGNMTLEIASKRKAERQAGLRNSFKHNSTYNYRSWRQRFKLRLLRFLCKLRSDGFNKLTFITHHHGLSIEAPDILIPLKTNLKTDNHKIDHGLIHVLGMPAVNRKIISERAYHRQLDLISNSYGHYRLEYFPHPAEGVTERSIVKQVLPEIMIREQDVPYETFFKKLQVYPAKVIGFYSSTLPNIASYGLKDVCIVSYRLDLTHITDVARRKRVSDIYDHFSNISNITIV